jgi:carbamoyl-phosphate synthase large subunit
VQLHVSDGGRADRVVVLRKLARTHGAVGNGTAVERVLDAADAGAVALDAARAIGLRGPVDIDVRRLADGVPAVLEINARFGAHSAHAPELVDAVLAGHGLLLEVVA